MEVPSRSALAAICLNISERSQVPSVVKLEECFEKNSLLASFVRSESWLNASAQLGLSALCQGGISHLLELGGPPGVAFKVVSPRGILSTGSSEGCCLLGLGDWALVWEEWQKWAVLPWGSPLQWGEWRQQRC